MKEQAKELERIEEDIYQAGRKLNTVIMENQKFQVVSVLTRQTENHPMVFCTLYVFLGKITTE